MLIRVKLAVPKVDDPRLGVQGVKDKDVFVWVNPERIVSIQAGRPGRFGILLDNGLSMPCEGEADQVAADINMVSRSGVMPQLKV